MFTFLILNGLEILKVLSNPYLLFAIEILTLVDIILLSKRTFIIALRDLDASELMLTTLHEFT